MCCVVWAVGCNSSKSKSENRSLAADFSTPEGAILKLEESYRNGDLEAAVACKDFRMEAEYMLKDEMKTKLPQEQLTDDIVQEAAEVLEMAYRAQMKKSGLPDFKGLRSTFPKKTKVKEDIYRVTEVCYFPDGGTSKQDLFVGRRNGEWKVLHAVE